MGPVIHLLLGYFLYKYVLISTSSHSKKEKKNCRLIDLKFFFVNIYVNTTLKQSFVFYKLFQKKYKKIPKPLFEFSLSLKYS